MLDLIEALRHLAVNNYIYCNVKPSNILLAQDGTVKLTDFSLTRKFSCTDKPVFEPN
jgi:serine/threonine protein kinase